jgi:hypothetical protein
VIPILKQTYLVLLTFFWFTCSERFLNDFALSFFTMRVPDEGNSRKNVVHTELDIDSGVGSETE